MKNKGFTLVEVLAVLVILGLLIIIITPTISGLLKDSKEELNKQQITTIINATKKYAAENIDILPDIGSDEKKYISVDELIEKGVIESSDNSNIEIDGCVVISYNNNYNQYDYTYSDTCK